MYDLSVPKIALVLVICLCHKNITTYSMIAYTDAYKARRYRAMLTTVPTADLTLVYTMHTSSLQKCVNDAGSVVRL